MNTLAYKIAKMIKQANPEQTHSVELMQYALTIILNTLSIVACSFLLGWSTGELWSTGVVLLSLMLLRMLSGGSHMRTAGGCFIVSVALCAGIPHLPSIDANIVLMMTLASAAIMLLFAPRPDRNARLRRDWLPYLKLLSVLVVCSNFAIGSQGMGWAFIIQAITIIPWRRGAA